MVGNHSLDPAGLEFRRYIRAWQPIKVDRRSLFAAYCIRINAQAQSIGDDSSENVVLDQREEMVSRKWENDPKFDV
jgi:hypothetical protein